MQLQRKYTIHKSNEFLQHAAKKLVIDERQNDGKLQLFNDRGISNPRLNPSIFGYVHVFVVCYTM